MYWQRSERSVGTPARRCSARAVFGAREAGAGIDCRAHSSQCSDDAPIHTTGRAMSAIERDQTGATAVTSGAADEGWVTAHTGAAGYRTDVGVRGHAFIADEPASVGGADSGPTPYDYLLAALGACTAMTLRMYADHKKWPLESVAVRLQHQKVYRRDCEECETKDRKIDRIGLELELGGALGESQRRRG